MDGHGGGTFRLHTENEPPSRLDPVLEMNRNLTNWGMTYRAGSGRTPRRTWDQGGFARSEMDLHYGGHGMQSVPGQVPDRIVNVVEAQPASRTLTRPLSYHSTSSGSPGPASIADPYLFSRINENQMTPPSQPLLDVSGSTSSGDNVLIPELRSAHKAKSVEPKMEKSFVVDLTQNRQSIEMEQKREQLMMNAVRRREMIEKKKEEAEKKGAQKKSDTERKQEEQERKKQEREARRQQVFEEYQKKKVEQEKAELGLGSSSTTTPRSPRVGRGHSQPPRPKSQVVHSQSVRVKAEARRQARKSGSADNMDQIAAGAAPSPSPTVASIQEPTVKPFVKTNPKSNRSIVINALQYSVFAGSVHDENRRKVLEELAKSDSKHFLLLFRDQKCQYRGLYSWDEQADVVHKLHGTGPKTINQTMMQLLFKYDSGAKKFTDIPTRHLSPTVDAFTIKDNFWQKTKLPHSGKR